jgi:hypothetical protein
VLSDSSSITAPSLLHKRTISKGPFLPPALPGLHGVGSEVAHKVALTLATVRRSNVVCGFPAPRFHENASYEIRRRPYRVGPAPHLSG